MPCGSYLAVGSEASDGTPVLARVPLGDDATATGAAAQDRNSTFEHTTMKSYGDVDMGE